MEDGSAAAHGGSAMPMMLGSWIVPCGLCNVKRWYQPGDLREIFGDLGAELVGSKNDLHAVRQERIHARRDTKPICTRTAGHSGYAACRNTDGAASSLEGRINKSPYLQSPDYILLPASVFKVY